MRKRQRRATAGVLMSANSLPATVAAAPMKKKVVEGDRVSSKVPATLGELAVVGQLGSEIEENPEGGPLPY